MQNLKTHGAKVVEQRGEIEKIPRHLYVTSSIRGSQKNQKVYLA